ncbi:hypothetical protein C0Q63_31710 [Streptomyces albidoflavus]|nr:hypothetical protein C0Q63_31710 [Streptomyces albidoflavus]
MPTQTRPPPGQTAGGRRRAAWLPEPLRHRATNILTAGNRLAQEATGTTLLQQDHSWRDDL